MSEMSVEKFLAINGSGPEHGGASAAARKSRHGVGKVKATPP